MEGPALFALATGAFFVRGGGWVRFPVLFLVPDLSMAGYLPNRRGRSATDDAAHAVSLPAVSLAGSWDVRWSPGIDPALVWLVHAGIGRAVGLGLIRRRPVRRDAPPTGPTRDDWAGANAIPFRPGRGRPAWPSTGARSGPAMRKLAPPSPT